MKLFCLVRNLRYILSLSSWQDLVIRVIRAHARSLLIRLLLSRFCHCHYDCRFTITASSSSSAASWLCTLFCCSSTPDKNTTSLNVIRDSYSNRHTIWLFIWSDHDNRQSIFCKLIGLNNSSWIVLFYCDHFALQYNGQMKAVNGVSSSSSSTSGYDQEDYNHHHQQPSLACLNQNLQPVPQLKANPASQINDDKLIELMERTGYNIVQKNGQRIFGGPPPGWTGVPPCKGTEIFVGKVPRNMFEWELVPIFQKVIRFLKTKSFVLLIPFPSFQCGNIYIFFARLINLISKRCLIAPIISRIAYDKVRITVLLLWLSWFLNQMNFARTVFLIRIKNFLWFSLQCWFLK